MVELQREEDWWLSQAQPPHQHMEGHGLAKGARMVVAPHCGQEIHPHYKKTMGVKSPNQLYVCYLLMVKHDKCKLISRQELVGRNNMPNVSICTVSLSICT
jgi:hypothetical protein